jgi:hypothetical protein
MQLPTKRNPWDDKCARQRTILIGIDFAEISHDEDSGM